MSISTLINRISYSGNGVTTAFSYPYQFLAAADLVVIERDTTTGVETTKALNTDYTVSGGNGSSGTVTAVTAPASGKTWTIYNDPALTQSLDLYENDVSPAETKERAWDRLTLIAQRLKDRIDRSVRLSEGFSSSFDPSMPTDLPRGGVLYVNDATDGLECGPGTAASRASKYLAFDSDGDPIASAGPVSGVPVSSFMETVLDDASAAAALTTLGVSAFIQTLLNDADAATARNTLGASGGLWPASLGGTGLSSYTAGDIPYASGAATFSKLALGSTGKQLVSNGSAPSYEDPIFFKNWIINGNFDFWQRKTTQANITTDTYVADRFKYFSNGGTAARFTLSQSTDVPTQAESGFQSKYSMKLACTTLDGSIGAAEAASVQYRMEGFDYAQLKGKTVVLSFWVKSNKTGTYGIGFRNAGAGLPDRGYAATYTINASNTWEKKTIAVTFNYSGGTDDFINNCGLYIDFSLLAGTDFHLTPTTWTNLSGNQVLQVTTSSQVNFADSTSNEIYFAQIMLNVGATAAPFSRAGGNVGGELKLCQRYYEKSYNHDVDPGAVTSEGHVSLVAAVTGTTETVIPFRVRKRIEPTTVTSYSTDGTASRVRDASVPGNVTPTIDTIGETSARIYWASTDTRVYRFNWIADAEL